MRIGFRVLPLFQHLLESCKREWKLFGLQFVFPAPVYFFLPIETPLVNFTVDLGKCFSCFDFSLFFQLLFFFCQMKIYELFIVRILVVIYSAREQITVRSMPIRKLLEKMILEAFLMVSMVRSETVITEINLGNVYVVRCTIWYHLYNLKNMKNTLGRVLFLVKLQAEHTSMGVFHIF